ncbi:DUF3558 domain-containing protein [Amycolatopsis sp. GM8]|uniref:DUF3558 domain-containing protein n=1 Tax=Amycolatopsis sp. GM8 TaxID=2896530 RepID=UPI001F4188DF|nr:DUF3558 domain-containing protein [Amycolatopsis sp. GM8]
MSKTRAFQLGAAALAAAGVLSACSGGTDAGSIPPATPNSGAATSDSSGGDLAPRVPSSLPTNTLLSDPCNALSADQVRTIGLTGPGARADDQTGPSCKWRSTSYDSNVVFVGALTANKNGLNDIYANQPKDKYFEPTTINGYPAVYADVTDNRSGGDCTLWVGVTDQLSAYVSGQIIDGPNKSNPCPVVERVATAMVQHLQGS